MQPTFVSAYALHRTPLSVLSEHFQHILTILTTVIILVTVLMIINFHSVTSLVSRQWRRRNRKKEKSKCLWKRMLIYLRERVMPRAEPSADCWDWPICTQGQRSRGRDPDNLTGRDWSLLGRHRLGRRAKRSHKGHHERQRRWIYTVHAVRVWVCLGSVWRAIDTCWWFYAGAVCCNHIITEQPCTLFPQDRPQTECTQTNRTVNVTN